MRGIGGRVGKQGGKTVQRQGGASVSFAPRMRTRKGRIIELVLFGVLWVGSLRRLGAQGRLEESLALVLVGVLAVVGAWWGLSRTGTCLRKCADPDGALVGSLLVPLVCACRMVADDELWLLRFRLALLFSFWFLTATLLEVGRSWVIGASILSLLALGLEGPAVVIGVALFPYLLSEFVSKWEYCFTLGEASAAASALCFVVTEVSRRLGTPPEPGRIVESVILDLLLAVTLGSVFLVSLARSAAKDNPWKFYAGLLVVIACIEYPLIFLTLREEPFAWVINFVTSSATRMGLVFYWVVLLITALAVLPPGTFAAPVIVTRKYYHGLALIIMLPAWYFDPELLQLSLSIALAMLMLLELLCIAHAGTPLAKFMYSLTDKRDRGVVTLSHMYLLIGCAVPIWLDPDRCGRATLSGIVSLGVYDAVASIVGSQWGSRKLSPSEKTLEGTFSGGIAALLSTTLLSSVACAQQTRTRSLHPVVTTAMMALFETYTEQNDNLVLAPFYYAAIHIL